jgi:SAM-dependent methyltransferase
MKPLKPRRINFDPIARPYRWLEYFSLGRTLERCRFHFLPQLTGRARALVLGDGDGRFLARLLSLNPALAADAVDISPAMLRLLRDRCEAQVPAAKSRLRTHHCDAFRFLDSASSARYDLVVTHFFLDCFSQSEVESLAALVAATLTLDGIWLISEFRIPSGAMRLPAQMYVKSLYFGFRLITGMQVNRLPDHAAALTRAGFHRVAYHRTLAGMLTTEMWAKIGNSGRQSTLFAD